MRVAGYEVTLPHAVLAGLTIVVLVATVIGLSTSAAAFGPYNPAWDGTEQFRSTASDSGADVVVGRSVGAYRELQAEGTTAVILSPTEEYTLSQADTIATFVDRGGTLVVADDFDPHTNTLLSNIGVNSRVDGRLVRDSRLHYRSPALPVATKVADTSLTRDVSRVTLNYGTVVNTTGERTILVNTSGFAYLDTNRNNALDADETVRQYPVAVSEPYGAGRVVVVSDPSVFVNSMVGVTDNRQFARNLVADSETVLFDYSHRSDVPPAVGIVLSVSDSPLLQLLIALVLVCMTGAAWSDRFRRIRR